MRSNPHSAGEMPSHALLPRRDFIRTAATLAASAAAARGLLAANSNLPAPTSAAPAGTRFTPRMVDTLRWLTLTVVNNDPGNYDPDFWLDYCKRCHVDAASWNSGGIIAIYPTKLKHHRINPAIGNSDPLRYLVDGCRKLGIVVTARVDHHATYDDTAEAHPEWIQYGADGKPRRHPDAPELWLTCTLGPYNEVFMTDVMKEVATMYQVDGFNHNRWSSPTVCHCAWCQESFGRFAGARVPLKEDRANPTWVKYVRWREQRIWELWDHWDREVRKINPDSGILPGVPMSGSQLKFSELRKRAHTLYLDYQGRKGLIPPWIAGKKGKELRAVLGDKPAGLTFSVGIEDRYRWKDSVQTDAELRVWVSDGVAHGLRPKVAKFCGVLYDHRWLAPVQELYEWQWKHERYLRNTASLARVGIVFSQQTSRFYQGIEPVTGTSKAGSGAGTEGDHANGFYHALVEARIPTEAVHEDFLTSDEIDRYAVLVLPNVAALSDAQCENLRAYVRRGGSLVATHESTLCNEVGERRRNFGLADVFGVDFAGTVEGPIKNSYLTLDHTTKHPLLAGFDPQASRIINGVYRIQVRPTAAFSAKPVTLIPSYPDLPMEEVYPRHERTDIAEVYLRELGANGRGRIAYFPWDIDRTFWEVMCPDHGQLLANAVRWAAGEPQPLLVEGAGLVDVAVWRQKDSITAHLVNLTNPMAMKGPFREIIPIGEQRVQLRLPAGVTPKRVHLLTAGRDVPYELTAGVLRVTVPSVAVHEVVAVDLA
jgi:hypothetical protein